MLTTPFLRLKLQTPSNLRLTFLLKMILMRMMMISMMIALAWFDGELMLFATTALSIPPPSFFTFIHLIIDQWEQIVMQINDL
eukprot:m.62408 g.62408  ORF g.62408 m.62408 type:complete len:83 (-) comp8030_c2_seq2:1753-2001(-)